MSGEPEGGVAYAVTHERERVAPTPPASLVRTDLDVVRRALMEERGVDAVARWISTTGTSVDAYPTERVWNERQLDEERAGPEVRVRRIFDDGG